MAKRSKERRDTCVLMADLLCRTEETDIAVHSNYTPKKKKRNKFTFVKKQLELMVTKREKVMGVSMNWEAGIDIYTLLLLLLLLLLSRFSRVVLTLCNPTDGTHQAPPSLGFSRQEHWSRFPFPSPMHESEK